jgi:hypothetical protein
MKELNTPEDVISAIKGKKPVKKEIKKKDAKKKKKATKKGWRAQLKLD